MVTDMPLAREYSESMDSTRVKLMKLAVVCVLCVGIVTGLVLLVEYLLTL